MGDYESKKYSWKFLTADELLSLGPCEVLYVYLVVSAASTDTSIYDGENTTGTLIATFVAAAVTGHEFSPPKPVYCRKGLYVDIGTNVTGMFVQWRELDRG